MSPSLLRPSGALLSPSYLLPLFPLLYLPIFADGNPAVDLATTPTSPPPRPGPVPSSAKGTQNSSACFPCVPCSYPGPRDLLEPGTGCHHIDHRRPLPTSPHYPPPTMATVRRLHCKFVFPFDCGTNEFGVGENLKPWLLILIRFGELSLCSMQIQK